MNTRQNTVVFDMMWMFLGGSHSGLSSVSRGSFLCVPRASARSDPPLWCVHTPLENRVWGIDCGTYSSLKKGYNVKFAWKLIGFFSNFHWLLQLARTRWSVFPLFCIPLPRPSLLCMSAHSVTVTAVGVALVWVPTLHCHCLVELPLP